MDAVFNSIPDGEADPQAQELQAYDRHYYGVSPKKVDGNKNLQIWIHENQHPDFLCSPAHTGIYPIKIPFTKIEQFVESNLVCRFDNKIVYSVSIRPEFSGETGSSIIA